jgi:N4-gp56 family major capsid protein
MAASNASVGTGLLSDEILRVQSRIAILKAQPNYVFRQFVDYKNEIGIEPGETIRFLKHDDLPIGTSLSEYTPMPKNVASSSYVDISVAEYGNSVQITRRGATAAFRDVVADYIVRLGRNYVRTLDTMLRDSYLASLNEQFAGGAASATAMSTSAFFTTDEIKDGVETLRTLNIPPLVRGTQEVYVCVAHPHQLRKLRDDVAWQRAHEYMNVQPIYQGESGMYEGVVFIETTQIPKLVDGNTVDYYTALLLGSDAVGFAESVPMEVTTDGVQDHGRFSSIGWYSIMGSGIINDHIVKLNTR